jgi:sugar lactone lactonase YvrE
MTWQAITSTPDALGESPLWLADGGWLCWVDIEGRALLRMQPERSSTVERWPLPQQIGCAAPVRTAQGGDAGWVLALRDGIYRAPAWGAPLHCLLRLPYDPATQRANDGKCDALGRLWVGTVHEPADGGPRQPLAALYCVDARAPGAPQVHRVRQGLTTANGLAWSPDGGTLYLADTPTHGIEAFGMLPGAAPQLGPARTLHRFAPKPAGWHSGLGGYGGRPDGACVDAEGAYWCALYEGARVLRIAPTGEVLAEFPLPAQCPTMPCLGGADGRTLFVTTARRGRPEAELARYPQSGCVFALRVAVPGAPAQPMRVA